MSHSLAFLDAFSKNDLSGCLREAAWPAINRADVRLTLVANLQAAGAGAHVGSDIDDSPTAIHIWTRAEPSHGYCSRFSPGAHRDC